MEKNLSYYPRLIIENECVDALTDTVKNEKTYTDLDGIVVLIIIKSL